MGVTTHEIVKEDPEGNYEDQEMCFYLPSQYQENHSHEEDESREARHEQMTAPAPLDNNKVYLKTRPAMYVFVRRFGGFPLKYKIEDYMTVGYDSPWKMVKRRNEVWMQCLEGTHPLPAPVARNHHQ